MENKEILYISSESDFNFHSYFDGYAFFGIDLVIGNKGFQRLLQEKGSCNKYEDGNYILIEKTNENNYILSRDYHGYYPIFYYSSGNYWCISNSIIYIAEQLKKREINISYDEANVESWKFEGLGIFNKQLTSHNTFIDGIKTLPVNQDILISRNKADSNIVLIERESITNIGEDYNTALKVCLETWRSRYLTIVSNPEMALLHDLTGGLDSRCLFSFIISNLKATKKAQMKEKLRVNSSPSKPEDFEIAKRLVSLFGLSLNTEISSEYKSSDITGNEKYAAWRYFNIGRYSPIIFSAKFNPKYLEIGGEGGEDNRNFYTGTIGGKYSDLTQYLKKYQYLFSSEERYVKWREQINQSVSFIKQDIETDVSILHYKEFRSNSHTNKNPKRRFKFAPLGSKYFDRLSQLSNQESLQSGQILYDIIYNNCDKLLYIPFDKHYKSISDKNIKNLSKVNVKKIVECGKVYWFEGNEDSNFFFNIPIDTNTKISNSPLKMLRNEALSSLEKNKKIIDYYFGSSYVELFHRKFNEIDFEKERANLHTKGSFLHALILLNIIDFLQK